MSILDAFSGPNEVELRAALVRPVLERAGCELRTVIHVIDRGGAAGGAPKASCTKSMLHRSAGPVGLGAGPRCRAMCLRRGTRVRSCSPRRCPRQARGLALGLQPAAASQPAESLPAASDRVRNYLLRTLGRRDFAVGRVTLVLEEELVLGGVLLGTNAS